LTSKKFTILHIGAEGMLGTQLGLLLKERNDVKVVSTSRMGIKGTQALDITLYDQVRELIECVKPCIIFNTTAYTNVDLAESEEPLANLINGDCVGMLATASKASGAFLVHISTDYVFPGSGDTPWKPNDLVSPINVYGSSKLLGEALIQESGVDYAIIRTSWLYGICGNHFIKTILSLAQDRGSLKVVSDQTGSPTNTYDLANCVIDLGFKRASGIHHFCNQGQCSWFDLASYAVKIKNIECDLERCSTDEFPMPAQRPIYSVLDCRETYEKLSWEVRSWQDSLTDYLSNEL